MSFIDPTRYRRKLHRYERLALLGALVAPLRCQEYNGSIGECLARRGLVRSLGREVVVTPRGAWVQETFVATRRGWQVAAQLVPWAARYESSTR